MNRVGFRMTGERGTPTRHHRPLNQPVVVRLTPKRGGTCGMDMMHGKLVVR